MKAGGEGEFLVPYPAELLVAESGIADIGLKGRGANVIASAQHA